MTSRIVYRSRQFFSALWSPKVPVADDLLCKYLTSAQINLFHRMQPSEQHHAFRVMQRLEERGQQHPDLLVAALLHDVGKVLHPLSPLERVLIVLGKKFFPRLASRWGQGTPSGLRRPFVVSAHHAAWGAELAEKAGASARTCDLIRRHQDLTVKDDPLLHALQKADDEN
jgi:hypothetical protein